MAAFTGSKVKPRIGLTPILRAGLGMTDALVRKVIYEWYRRDTNCWIELQLKLFPYVFIS